jgi:hypothetical protein
MYTLKTYLRGVLMKNVFCFLLLVAVFATPIFAEDESPNTVQNKHRQFDQYFGLSIGGGGMRMNGSTVITTDVGVTYNVYLFNWFSLNAGFIFHKELGERQFTPNGNTFCFTVPLGVHFNIPKAEWLYAGINFAVNIPIVDMNSPNDQNIFTQNDTFFSMPIDLGFDFMKPGRGGSRLLLTVTPTFYNGGTSVPVGIVWQIYNWKVFAPKVEVNVPPPPVIIVNR